MEVRFEYEPLPVHKPFHAAGTKYKAMFGAYGSGKSYALCSEAIAFALEQPGSYLALCRKYVTSLKDTTEQVFFDILPRELFMAGKHQKANNHYAWWEFPNGSRVYFLGLDDVAKHMSLNLSWIGYDEADQLDRETVDTMSSRLRQRVLSSAAKNYGYTGTITRRQICFASNPAGHNWLWSMFVDDKGPTHQPNSSWFRSTAFDNPYLPGDFIRDMLTKPEPWIRRYVLCQFDDFAGQIFPEWSWDTHVIKRPDDWGREAFGGNPVWMAFDPGTRSPNAGLWVVHDRKRRRLVAVHEYQEEGLKVAENARRWRQIEAKMKVGRVAWRVADPSVNTRERGTMVTLADLYAKEKFTFDNGALTHKSRIPPLQELVANHQFVMLGNCPILFDQMANYRWEDIAPARQKKGADAAETPVKGKDHVVDCAQYIAAGKRVLGPPITPQSALPAPIEVPVGLSDNEIEAAATRQAERDQFDVWRRDIQGRVRSSLQRGKTRPVRQVW